MCVEPLDMSTSEGWPVAIVRLFALKQVGESAHLPDIRFSTPGSEACVEPLAGVSDALRHPLTTTKRASRGARFCRFIRM
jgi:hypothetical protein